MTELFQLRCRECGRLWGNIPRSYCEECLAPLEITYDYAALRGRVTRESITARPWEFVALSRFAAASGKFSIGFADWIYSAGAGSAIGCSAGRR